MATTPEAAAPATVVTARPRRSKKKLLLALALLLAGSLGGGLFLFLQGSHAMPAPPPEPPRPIFVNFEPLTVNLQSEGKPRFLHLAISLKVRDEKTQARVAESLPDLRSRLLLLLSNRDPAGLATPQAKTALADEIRKELSRPPVAGGAPYGISGVAFTAFVVQ